MKAKSRKRLLISSIAMLLVAMLALGTATFAWFTTSTTSRANGIGVKTIKSSKLEISKLNKVWGTTVDYQTANRVLLPVSSANGNTWIKANAASPEEFKAASGSGTTAAAQDYFVNQLNVRNSGEADVENAQVTFTINNQVKAEYIRVALVPVTDADTNTDSIPTVATASDFTGNIYDTQGETYKALTNTSLAESGDITAKNSLTLALGNAGAIAAGATYYYNLYVWFEGQDVDCKDANAGASIGDIQFTVTGSTVSQS